MRTLQHCSYVVVVVVVAAVAVVCFTYLRAVYFSMLLSNSRLYSVERVIST
jgi:hypothetical protein